MRKNCLMRQTMFPYNDTCGLIYCFLFWCLQQKKWCCCIQSTYAESWGFSYLLLAWIGKHRFVHARAENIFQKAGAVFRSYDGSYWFCLFCPKLGDNVLVEKFKEQCYIMVSIPVGYSLVLLLFFIEILWLDTTICDNLFLHCFEWIWFLLSWLTA